MNTIVVNLTCGSRLGNTACIPSSFSPDRYISSAGPGRFEKTMECLLNKSWV